MNSHKDDLNQDDRTKFRKVLDFIKNRYFLKADLDVLLVFLQFALTGSSSVRVGKVVLPWLGITPDLPSYAYWPLRIVVVFIVYQILFILIGYLLGLVRNPIWDFTKFFGDKMLSRLGIKFLGDHKN